MHCSIVRLTLLSIVAVSLSCGGGGDHDVIEPPAPTLALTLNATTISLQAGTASGSVVATVVRTGTTGVLQITVEGLPNGVTSPQISIEASTPSVAVPIVLTSTPATSAGTYTIIVRASASGVESRTATFQLTITAPAAQNIALALAPAALSIAQGSTGSTNVTITRTNFTGAVSLSAGGGPAGMTFSFTPTSVTGTQSSMTVAIAATTAPGAYAITVQGTATGLANATATLTVTVTGPPASIALSAAPPTLSVAQGQSGTSQLSITRSNFTGGVNLTSSGAPAGMTVTLSPTSTSGTSAAVTVAVNSSLVAGNYSITVQASGTGVTSTSIVIPVTVTVPGGSGNVTFTFCQQSGLPLWFAYSDNGAAFTRLTAPSGVYNFTVGQKGRVAWVMQEGARTRLELFYGSLQDLNARGRTFCRGNGSTKTVNASVSGVTAGQTVSVSMAGGFANATGPVASPLTLTNVQDGLADLVAVRQSAALPAVTNSIAILRDRNDANGANISVDFTAAVAPVTRTATIANLGGDQASVVGGFLSKNGTLANFSLDVAGSSTTRAWMSLPDASVVPGDWHMQTVIASPPTALGGYPFRSYQLFTRFGTDRTLTLPPMIVNQPSFVISSVSPYVTFGSQWIIQSPEYNDFWQLILSPATGNVSSVVISGTVGYFGGGPARLDLPTFDATFNPQHGLQPGITVAWTFFAAGGTAWGNSIGHAALPNEGEFATTGGIAGSFVP